MPSLFLPLPLAIIRVSEFCYKPPWVDGPFEESCPLCTKVSLQNSSSSLCSGKHSLTISEQCLAHNSRSAIVCFYPPCLQIPKWIRGSGLPSFGVSAYAGNRGYMQDLSDYVLDVCSFCFRWRYWLYHPELALCCMRSIHLRTGGTVWSWLAQLASFIMLKKKC